MAIIVIARGLIDSTVVDASSNRPKSVLMAPFTYINNATLNNQTNYDLDKFSAAASAVSN